MGKYEKSRLEVCTQFLKILMGQAADVGGGQVNRKSQYWGIRANFRNRYLGVYPLNIRNIGSWRKNSKEMSKYLVLISQKYIFTAPLAPHICLIYQQFYFLLHL